MNCARYATQWTRVLATGAMLLCTGCSIFGPDDDLLERLSAERRAWQRLNITDYELVLEVSCFCEPAFLQPVRLRVRDRVTVSIVRAATGDTVPAIFRERYYNVDQLFDWLETYLLEEGTEARITYDPVHHFAATVEGHTRDAVDGGITYRTTEFAPQQAAAATQVAPGPTGRSRRPAASRSAPNRRAPDGHQERSLP